MAGMHMTGDVAVDFHHSAKRVCHEDLVLTRSVHHARDSTIVSATHIARGKPSKSVPLSTSSMDSDSYSRYHHTQRFATNCGHQIHVSAPEHTPHCPRCIVRSAKRKLEHAQHELLLYGGYQRPSHLRDGNFNKACLVHDIAARSMARINRKDQLRWERERVWDEAHLQTDLASIDEGWTSGSEEKCPVCVLDHFEEGEPICKHPDGQRSNGGYMVWWEQPGALAPPKEEASTPPQPRPRLRYAPKGSQLMRSIICECRTRLKSHKEEQKRLSVIYRTEEVVRRKHQLSEDLYIAPEFWESPISNLLTRQQYLYNKNAQRLSERRARGNKARPCPGRSSLFMCENADENGGDEVSEEWQQMKEEATDRDRLERAAQTVGEEVGYLYFVGNRFDGLIVWRRDYLRSNPDLIWRAWEVPGIPQDLLEGTGEMEVEEQLEVPQELPGGGPDEMDEIDEMEIEEL
ncbi:hypothetical protein P280DRAFT_504750 [Massarina eburnea CBS 473.64]|uniref:Uncharacterized protein n=1 Tax=Massarina eburnea CBS 473.64 TaxID=1395130 RepID=A0A6A6SAN3_9PLEO|nr:hypothetical protein P280DRAFT_504750 [Massarina eburnea CBS 473.64]